jgi:ABC-2 type transport system permease protein
MTRRLSDAACVFHIHLARLRAESGPFLLAGIVFPCVMYMFAAAVASGGSAGPAPELRIRFLAGSIVFSLSMTGISWLGYLLLENRFTGRLKLFATLPLAPSSYVFGIVAFALAQAVAGTISLLVLARFLGVHPILAGAGGVVRLFAVVLLTVLCVSGISLVIAARARSFSEGSLATDALGAGLVFLAPVYYSPDTLPRVLRSAAYVLPTTYAADGVRILLGGGTAVGRELLVLAAMTVVTLGTGFRMMRWREE